MIEPYDLSSNSNLSQMFDGVVENTFYVLLTLSVVWLIGSLIIWLIRKPYKIRKSNKIWC